MMNSDLDQRARSSETSVESTRPTISVNPDAAAHAAHALHEGVKIERTIHIKKSAADVFSFCRDFTNLTRFVKGLTLVAVESPVTSSWRYSIGGLFDLHGLCEIIAESESRMISWRSTSDSEILQAGSIWFTPDEDGTEVRVQFLFRVKAEAIHKRIGLLLTSAWRQEPAEILDSDLLRLKLLLESDPH